MNPNHPASAKPPILPTTPRGWLGLGFAVLVLLLIPGPIDDVLAVAGFVVYHVGRRAAN